MSAAPAFKRRPSDSGERMPRPLKLTRTRDFQVEVEGVPMVVRLHPSNGVLYARRKRGRDWLRVALAGLFPSIVRPRVDPLRML